MSALLFGPDGGVPPGYARCPAGTILLRGHSPDKLPDWFGPAVGTAGTNRFDWPFRNAGDPGVCYLAPQLTGVLLERVIRDVPRRVLSVAQLDADHAVTTVRLTRDLLLVDLLSAAWTVHGVQVATITAPPPYGETQRLAERLHGLLALDRRHLGTAVGLRALLPDGIAYGSRFGALHECLALWDRARGALVWGDTAPFSADRAALAHACQQLGIGLLR